MTFKERVYPDDKTNYTELTGSINLSALLIILLCDMIDACIWLMGNDRRVVNAT